MYREVKIEKGSLTVAGFNLVKIKKKDVPLLRRSVGVVFQDYKLLPKKTVYENIAYAMEVIGESRRNIKKRVMEVLDLVGLKHKVPFSIFTSRYKALINVDFPAPDGPTI